jgi:iron complex outermembrane recepter protein
VSRELNLLIKINGLLDKQYATFGVLGENFSTGPGNTYDCTNTWPAPCRSRAAP